MNKKMTIPVEVAKAMVTDMPELEAAIEAAVEAGWAALSILAEQNDDGTYEVSVEPPSGVMVAWFLPGYQARSIAVPGGEHSAALHVTLAYFGDAADMTVEDQRTLIGVVGEVSLRHHSLMGELTGVGRFSNGEETEPLWVGVDVPGLQSLHDDIVKSAAAAGIDVKGHGTNGDYKPHVTVAYVPADRDTSSMGFAPMSVTMDTLTVAIAERRVDIKLVDPGETGMDVSPHQGWQADMSKAVGSEVAAEDRYTLGPLYVPDSLDAHGEWTDTREIQKAVWQYTRAKQFDIRLQHNTDIVAGECVEVLTWPYEVTVPMTKADGTTTDVTFPPGTPFMGTVWEPWAWGLVKEGKLTGYSIGGRAHMIEVDLGAGDVKAAEEAGATDD